MNGPGTRRWPDAAREAALVSAALLLCPAVAVLAVGDAGAAVARAHELVELERRLGLFVEPALHAGLQVHPWLLAAAGAFYVWVHVPALLGMLAWLWITRPDAFRAARDWFLLTQALVVAGYVLLPTAPPRLLPGLGFQDTLTQLWGAGASDLAHSVQSPYAAMPSGHVAFALIVGVMLARHASSPVLRACGIAYPALVVLVVLATANHFWLDAAAGAAVTVTAAGALGGAGRWRARSRTVARVRTSPAPAPASG